MNQQVFLSHQVRCLIWINMILNQQSIYFLIMNTKRQNNDYDLNFTLSYLECHHNQHLDFSMDSILSKVQHQQSKQKQTQGTGCQSTSKKQLEQYPNYNILTENNDSDNLLNPYMEKNRNYHRTNTLNKKKSNKHHYQQYKQDHLKVVKSHKKSIDTVRSRIKESNSNRKISCSNRPLSMAKSYQRLTSKLSETAKILKSPKPTEQKKKKRNSSTSSKKIISQYGVCKKQKKLSEQQIGLEEKNQYDIVNEYFGYNCKIPIVQIEEQNIKKQKIKSKPKKLQTSNSTKIKTNK